MISINKISKSYGREKALNNISLEIREGELFGLIGPDGAGKTSLFRILATLLLPDSGTAEIAGFDLKQFRKIRHLLGYMPGRFSLYQDLSVSENLQFFATIFGTTIEENFDLIEDIYKQLVPFKNRRAGALSGGMKQKLALSCALIHRPKVLLLDEPTTGVDPVSRNDFWGILKTLNTADITILVSTPFMDEAARCGRIAFIDKGEILAIDTPDGITSHFSEQLYAVRSNADMYTLLADLNSYAHTNSAYAFGAYLHYTDLRGGGIEVMEALRTYLSEKGHGDIEIRELAPNIEDTFIKYMSEET